MRFGIVREHGDSWLQIGRLSVRVGEDYSQFFSRCNWYSFSVVQLYLEDSRYLGQGSWELQAAMLGLRLMLCWEAREESEFIREVGGSVEEMKTLLEVDGSVREVLMGVRAWIDGQPVGFRDEPGRTYTGDEAREGVRRRIDKLLEEE